MINTKSFAEIVARYGKFLDMLVGPDGRTAATEWKHYYAKDTDADAAAGHLLLYASQLSRVMITKTQNKQKRIYDGTIAAMKRKLNEREAAKLEPYVKSFCAFVFGPREEPNEKNGQTIEPETSDTDVQPPQPNRPDSAPTISVETLHAFDYPPVPTFSGSIDFSRLELDALKATQGVAVPSVHTGKGVAGHAGMAGKEIANKK